MDAQTSNNPIVIATLFKRRDRKNAKKIHPDLHV